MGPLLQLILEFAGLENLLSGLRGEDDGNLKGEGAVATG